MSKLLSEECQDVEFLIEEVGKEKNYSIKGIFMQAEKPNKNGRVYPKNIMERENQRYNNNYIVRNRAYGELGHPDSPTINLDRVSHMIIELHAEGNDYVGKAKILDTPNGKIVKNLLDAGGQLGVSTRGVGSLTARNGVNVVGEDFFLSAVDIVADPSAPDAFVNGLMEEKEWVYENGVWSEQELMSAKKSLQEASRMDYEDKVLNLFSKFMNQIR